MSAFFMMPFSVKNESLPKLDPSKIDPLIGYETNAFAHWSFTDDINSLNDLVKGSSMVQLNDPRFTPQGVVIQGHENPADVKTLQTGFTETQSSTMVVVFKTPSQANWIGNNLSLCGAFSATSSGSLCYIDSRSMQLFIPPSTQESMPFGQPLDYDTWYIMAWSFDFNASGNGTALSVAGGFGSKIDLITGRTYSNKKVELGMTYVYSDSYSKAEVEISEFIYFDKGLSLDEVQAVIARSKIRMAKKGINLVI